MDIIPLGRKNSFIILFQGCIISNKFKTNYKQKMEEALKCSMIKNISVKNREIFVFLAVVIAAFLVRLIYLSQLKSNPLFIPSQATLDEYLYHTWASDIVHNGPIAKGGFWGLPLYPYFLSLIYRVFGENFYIARLANFILGSLSCGLLYIIGKKIFNRTIGILAGLTLAFYNAAIFYEGFLIASALSVFLTCLFMMALFNFEENTTSKNSAILGASMGFLSLTAPSIFVTMPLLFIMFFKKAKYFLIAVIFCFLIILPVAVRNYIVEKDFILITAHGGITFYGGNNYGSVGTGTLPPDIGTDVRTNRENSKIIAERTMGRKLKPSEISSFWFNEGIKFIKSNPIAYLKLEFKKFLLFWNHIEIGDFTDIDFFKRFVPFLKLPLIKFMFISTFSLLGIFISFSMKSRNNRLLEILVLGGMISLMLYFVTTRYRLVVVPALALFSSLGIYSACKYIIQRKTAAFFVCITSLAVFFIFGSIKVLNLHLGAFNVNMSFYYLSKKMYKEAAEECKEAIKRSPGYSLAHNNLGIAYKNLGNLAEAKKEYKLAILHHPGSEEAHYNLGLLYIAEGNELGAIRSFKKVLEINPRSIDANNKLGKLYLNKKDVKTARAYFNNSLALDPNQKDIINLINK